MNMTYEEARNYILANYFDGDEDVKAVVGGDEEHWAMKYAVEALEKQILKKVTEDEIIDALECRCCVFRPRCSSCPHQDFCCIARIATDGLNLIRKQQAEIERLKAENNRSFDKWIILEERTKKRYEELYQEAKAVVRAEAIREFVERLKEMKYESIEWSHGKHPYVVEESDIDNLVEEMVGEK